MPHPEGGSGTTVQRGPAPYAGKVTKREVTKELIGPKARERTIPEDWTPNLKARNYASENGIDLDHEADQFVNHHGSKGSRFVNWDLAFRTWLGNAKKWSRPEQRVTVNDGRPEGW